jgi:hypothetical protein
MGLGWVLLSLMVVAIALWQGTEAWRESARLSDRLAGLRASGATMLVTVEPTARDLSRR